METGEATVWASAIGVAGTLFGALGGALAGAITARKQAREQAREQGTIEHGHWLRAQRQAAYTAILTAADSLSTAQSGIIERAYGTRLSRVVTTVEWRIFRRSETDPVDVAVAEARRAAVQVNIVGPERMGRLATRICHMGVGMLFIDTTDAEVNDEAFERTHQDFITEAHRVLGTAPQSQER